MLMLCGCYIIPYFYPKKLLRDSLLEQLKEDDVVYYTLFLSETKKSYDSLLEQLKEDDVVQINI